MNFRGYVILKDDSWEELIQKICGFLEKEDLADDKNDPYNINDPYDDYITLIPLNKEIEDSQWDDLIKIMVEDKLSREIIEKSHKTALKIESINNKAPLFEGLFSSLRP